MQQQTIEDSQARDTAWIMDAVHRMRLIDQKRVGDDKLGAFSLQDGAWEDLFDLRELDLLVASSLTALVADWRKAMRDNSNIASAMFELAKRRVLYRAVDGFMVDKSGETRMLAVIERCTHLTHVQSVILFRTLAIALCERPPEQWNGLAFEKRELGVSVTRPEAG